MEYPHSGLRPETRRINYLKKLLINNFFMSFLVRIIPLFADNYCYFMRAPNQLKGVLVDPADPKKVLERIKAEQVGAVIYTHKHLDHAGESPLLHSLLPPDTPFYAGHLDAPQIPCISHPMDRDQWVGMFGLRVLFLWTPCHTRGHVCLMVQPENEDGPQIH
jgi:hydroxyacylglutathione hydrolase